MKRSAACWARTKSGNEISLVDESKALIADSTNAVSTNVVSHTNAIGYISLGSYDSTQVKAVSVNDVECTEENIVAGTYTIARPFLLVAGSRPPMIWPARSWTTSSPTLR